MKIHLIQFLCQYHKKILIKLKKDMTGDNREIQTKENDLVPVIRASWLYQNERI